MTQTKEESSKLFKKICRMVGVTMRDNNMVAEGDHILAGISGGKDSLVMLEVLAERRSAVPFNFDITAVHVKLSNIGYEISVERMRQLCETLKINLIIFEDTVELQDGKAVCYQCSRKRRKILFDLSKEYRCNKIAMGHHRNDAIETLLMNMIYHGSISSLPKKLSMFDGRVELIRPLIDLNENLIKDYAERRDYNIHIRSCNFEKENKREEIQQLIEKIEKLHGKGSFNMYKSMSNIYPEYLP